MTLSSVDDVAPDTPEHEIVAHIFKLYAKRV